MINNCARRAKTALMQRINATEKVSYCKGSIFALLRLFVHYSNFSLLIKPFNATHAKITYLCNRFGLFGECCFISTFKLGFPHSVYCFSV